MIHSLSQFIVGEPSVLFMAGLISTGVGWTLKKIYDVERRLTTMETRCKILTGKCNIEPPESIL